jgi:hypothetical protein
MVTYCFLLAIDRMSWAWFYYYILRLLMLLLIRVRILKRLFVERRKMSHRFLSYQVSKIDCLWCLHLIQLTITWIIKVLLLASSYAIHWGKVHNLFILRNRRFLCSCLDNQEAANFLLRMWFLLLLRIWRGYI